MASDVNQIGTEAAPETRFVADSGSPDLRVRTARGTIVNAGFLVGTNGLQLIKGLAVATFLSTAAYGIWGLLMAAFMTLLTLGSIGVDDKYIQQDEPDQQRAFEVAFTLQTLLCVVLFIAMLIGMPLFALLYGRPAMIAPGLAFSLAVPAIALQMPIWTHYRRMDFVRQRSLQAIDPIVSFIAVMSLAIAGLGIWALVCGELLGTWCAGVAIFRSSPYPIRFRWDRGALHEYSRFSWPLFVAAIGTVLMFQVPVAVSSRVLGVAAVAGIALAGNIMQFTNQVDTVVSQTLYPAICAVKDNSELLFESFVKSNRVALLWAAPLGAAATLFAGDFVHVIGDKWQFAVPLIIAFGINAMINQIGFNWTAFFRAMGDTRPLGVGMAVQVGAVMVIAIPLLIVDGLTGFGIGFCMATTVSVAVRMWYLRRIFPGLAPLRHIAAGIGPALPGVAVVLLIRALDPGPRTVLRVATEAVAFSVVVIAATCISQRTLLSELIGYLRGRSPLAGRRTDQAAHLLGPG